MENILHIHRVNKVKAVSRRFNLIELMVVILVIAIIAAFILSSISRAREYALQTSCANNLHQISIAHQSYKAEYKYFPRPYSWLDDFSLIYPYTLSFNVFKCPGKYPKTKIEKISDLNGGVPITGSVLFWNFMIWSLTGQPQSIIRKTILSTPPIPRVRIPG